MAVSRKQRDEDGFIPGERGFAYTVAGFFAVIGLIIYALVIKF